MSKELTKILAPVNLANSVSSYMGLLVDDDERVPPQQRLRVELRRIPRGTARPGTITNPFRCVRSWRYLHARDCAVGG